MVNHISIATAYVCHKHTFQQTYVCVFVLSLTKLENQINEKRS